MAAGFIVAPVLVHRMGAEGYGLWIVVGSLSGYFSLIDFGLRSSVGRQLAYERANENPAGSSEILSTALVILSCIALLALALTLVGVAAFGSLFHPRADLVDDARLALLLVGINLAISFPLQAFDGNLWAAQRFDILNFVDIPTTILRVALTFAFVHDSKDIVALATITLVTTIGSGAAKAILGFRHDPLLRVRLRYVKRASARSLVGYGWWSFVLTASRMTKTQLAPILIGSLVGVSFVTPFSIARRLQDYAYRVLWTATGVLTPVATRFFARSQTGQQQELFIQGGKYSTAAAIYFVTYFVCLGGSFIHLWMGPAFTYVATLLIVLTIGEFLQMTQSVTTSIVLATGRHKPLAWLTLGETIISVMLMIPAARLGLVAICLSQAVPQLLFSGIGTLVWGCHITGTRPQTYIRRAILPALLAAAAPAALLLSLITWRAPLSWPVLLAYSTLYTLVFGACCWWLMPATTAPA